MNRWPLKRPLTFAAIGLILTASAAHSQVKSLKIVSHRPPDGVLPGYIVNDLFLDFDGLYTGSQMIFTLDSGEIYQNPHPLASDYPPIAAAIELDPRIEWDTFLANGGPTAADNASSFSRGEGAAINVDQTRNHPDGSERLGVFSAEDIDVYWGPAGGAGIVSRTDFMVARITLAPDTYGTLQFTASANQVIGVPAATATGLSSAATQGEQVPGGASGESRIAFLVLGGTIHPVVPEPLSVVLLGVALIGIVGVRAARRTYGRVSAATRRTRMV